MKVIKNTLEIVTEIWDEPEDFHHNQTLSYKYIAGLKGKLVLTLDGREKVVLDNNPYDFLADILDEYTPERVIMPTVDFWKLEPIPLSLLYSLTIKGIDIVIDAVRLED